MPDDSPEPPAPATVAPPGGSGPPGAVPGPSISGGAGGDSGSAATPPMSGPVAQAVPPRGSEMKRQRTGGLILRELNKMLGDLNPGDEVYQAIAKSIQILSKHFAMAMGPSGGQPMPTPQMAPGGRPGGGPPMPMMSGGPQAAMAPRGPAAMPG